MPIAETL